MRYEFLTCDVFTERRFGGNQLAVLPAAEGLEPARMQAIAAEFHFSETVFVLPAASPAHHARLRIFTPRAEIPFAGHPTVGTALALAWLGRVPREGRIVLEEGAGPVPVELSEVDGALKAEFTAPEPPRRGPAAEPRRVAELVGLDVDDLVTADGLPCDASAGLPFLVVEVRDQAALARTSMRGRGEDLSPASASGFYLFTRGDREVFARMYAPSHGVIEDPATGSAAAALAGLLAAEAGREDGWHAWTIHQGREMGRPSRIKVRALRAADAVAEVRVGGHAVRVTEGTIEVDP
jgi:trans-2,3-dihydro-3-hydroxyanthranilate isomerase